MVNQIISNEASIVESWMTKLWAWADEFSISEDDLPRNKKGLITITELDISSKNLTEIPESIGQLSELRQLDISENPLITLPVSITKLKNLKYIIINDREYERYATRKANEPSMVPKEIADYLRDLGEGCIGWNYPIVAAANNPVMEFLVRHGIRASNEVWFRLQSKLIKKDVVISKSIDRQDLQIVNDWAQAHADFNSHIEKDIYRLANKTHIHIISYNETIPKAIGCLIKLKGLFIHSSMSSNDNCQADDRLPTTIVNLVNLEQLSFVCPDHNYIPTNLYELKNLKVLEITLNNLTAIPEILTMMNCEIKLHLNYEHEKLPNNLLKNLADIRHLTELTVNGVLQEDLK